MSILSRKKYANQMQDWSEEDLRLVAMLAPTKANQEFLSKTLQRSPGAIEKQWENIYCAPQNNKNISPDDVKKYKRVRKWAEIVVSITRHSDKEDGE